MDFVLETEDTGSSWSKHSGMLSGEEGPVYPFYDPLPPRGGNSISSWGCKLKRPQGPGW